MIFFILLILLSLLNCELVSLAADALKIMAIMGAGHSGYFFQFSSGINSGGVGEGGGAI